MRILYFCCLSLLIFSGFGCKKRQVPEAIAEREKWIAGFNDSVASYENRISEISTMLNECNDRINDELTNFEYVSKPKEVTGYYILKGWKSKVPLTSTGIYARINEDEKIELLATLSGGVFNSLKVSNGVTECTSQVVPYDQALNYRHGAYNTVCFVGEAADSVAQFISDHYTEKLYLYFMNGNQKRDFVIPENEKTMVAATWNLLATQLEQKNLQKDLWMTSKKLEIFRKKIVNSDTIKNKTL